MLVKILKMMYFHPYQYLKMSHTTFIFPYDMSTEGDLKVLTIINIKTVEYFEEYVFITKYI